MAINNEPALCKKLNFTMQRYKNGCLTLLYSPNLNFLTCNNKTPEVISEELLVELKNV
jgi:hypothetical protein